jgi:hypothetical protein
MADLSVLSTGVSPVWPEYCQILSVKAAADVTAGQPGYLNTSGKGDIADANGVSPINRFRGIYLQTVKAGQTVDLLISGYVQGYDLSGLAYDAAVYVSDTVGKLADAAGTTSLMVGRVFPINDPDKTKVLRVLGYAG